MAASAEIIGEPLPEHWTYGVTADGRVFYIDDLHETTSWVHPVTNKPAASGLLSSSDLPSGWEWSITPEGVVYYVDHNTQRTTFIHPLTRKAAPPLNDVSQSIESQRPSSLKPVPQQQTNKKPSARQRIIDKGPEAQRMSNSKVILSGWLTVQESNSIRSWKRRWCVHADYGLFFYRDTTEQQCVGSILLPSYTIRPCDVSDPVNKRYAFKAEHANLRTQYFFAESRGNMDEWVRVLSQSAQMLNSESGLDKFSGPQRPASPENENEYYVLARDVAQNGELRYQRTTYPKEETPPEYYPIDRQPSVSSKEYSPYSNIPSSEYSYRNSYSPNHPSPTHPSSPRLFHSQQNASFGEATPNRNSYSSIGSPYNQRHDYSYKSAKPPERNPGSPPRPSPQRQSVSSSVSPYPDVTSSVAYSSLDFNAMYHNEHLGEHPSPPGSYQSIGSPHSLDSNSMTVPKTIEAESYSGPPPSQNALSHYSSNNLHSPESFRNHRNYSPLERGPDRDSYSSRGELDRSQLSYEMYLHNDSHGKDLPNLNLSQENFVLNHSDIAAPFSKRLSGAQTNLSKLAVDSDNGDQRSVDTESHQDYATICRIRSESMCTSPEMLRSRPASISASQHGSDTDVPKRTSIERLQEMHLRELQRHSHLSRSFSSGNVPNYHIISQTLSQEDDENGALQDAQSYGDDRKQEDPFFKRNSTSSQPQMEYQSGNRSLSPASELQNQIVYDYQGMGHDSTLPTHTSQGLSVKPQKYPSNVYLGQNGKPYNNYMNVKNRNSYSDFVNKTDSVELTSADMERDLYNMDYKQHSQSFERNDHHMSYDSASNIKPTGLAYNFMEPDSSNHSQHGSEISDAYINYQTASNLQSASGTPSERQRHQNGIHERNMNTVKEDPNMPDTAVIETVHPMFAKLNASQGRLRMSISAGDLLGKTHEELVLLLIQLRRNKTNLERCRESLRKQIDQLRPFEQEYKRQLQEANTVDFQLEDRHGYFMELKRQCGEVENKLEMYKPIENLVDNMVTMGSLYGGNNYMLATQYRKHILNPDEYIPPKKMIEFSRQHQEDVIIQKIEKDVRELTNDEADLEEKMERLCVLDRLIQEQSFSVTSLREDKEALEKTLRDIQYEQNRPSDRSQKQMEHLANQQHTVDKELSKAMLQLAEASKKLEELNAESSKLEHEIALLRSNVHGELNRSRSVPSLMEDPNHTRYKMEKDLHRVKDVMDNLSKEGARLSQALHTLKLPPEMNDEIATSNKQKPSTYMETDLDSKESYDLACETSPMFSPEGSSNLDYHEGHVGFVKYVRPSSIPSQLQVENNNSALASSPVLLESHREQPLHSQLPSQFKAGGQEVGVAVPVTSTLDGDISYEEENMWDISDADDNTKRFFGLLPKERPRVQTVRDVKRQAGQRRERGANEKFRGRTNDEEAELGDLWSTRPPNTSSADYLANNPPELTPHSYNLDKSSEKLFLPSSISQSLDHADYNNPPSPLPPPPPPPPPNSMPPYSSQNLFTKNNPSASISPPPLPSSPPPLPPLPQLQQPSTTTVRTDPDPDFLRRRSSLHSLPQRLLGPKPFTPYSNTVALLPKYEDKVLPVETVLPMKNTDTNNSEINPEISEPSVGSSVLTNSLFAARPWATGVSVPKLKRSPRGRNRYLTISSSEPIKLEHALQKQSSINSSAGDLIPGATFINNMPDIVSSTIDKFDEETIDRELMKPEMVFIPERYIPDCDEEDLTEEEKEKRRAKAEKIRKVLTEQSVHSWTKQIPAGNLEKIHDHIAKEKILREHLLTITQELAKEVTKKSKEAAVERRKTWAGTPSTDYLKFVYGEKDCYVEDILSG